MPARKRQLRWWERILERITSSRPGGWYFIHVASRIDRWLIPASNGRLHTTFSWPALPLTTTGAKSGQQRTTPLIYLRDGENIILIASNGCQLRKASGKAGSASLAQSPHISRSEKASLSTRQAR